MSNWDQASKEANRASGGNFLKLKDGDSIEGVFVGEPYTFYSAFKEKEEYQSWKEGRSFRFRVNFLVLEGGKWVPRIFQQGATTLKAIVECRNEYTLNCVFKIKRTGSTKEDTLYSVLFKRQLEQAERDALMNVKLLELGTGRGVKESGDEPPPHSDADMPPPESDLPF